MLKGITLVQNIEGMLWLTSVWHAFNSQPLNLQKISKYYGSFIRHSDFSRKAYPGLDSVQREVLRLYQRHKMQQLYHPIDGAAIPSLGRLFSLVDLPTRKITLKCQVEIQSILFSFLKFLFFPLLYLSPPSNQCKALLQPWALRYKPFNIWHLVVFLLIFEPFGLSCNNFQCISFDRLNQDLSCCSDQLLVPARKTLYLQCNLRSPLWIQGDIQACKQGIFRKHSEHNMMCLIGADTSWIPATLKQWIITCSWHFQSMHPGQPFTIEDLKAYCQCAP